MEVVVTAVLVTALAERALAGAWFDGSLFAGWRAAGQSMRDDGSWRLTRFVGGAVSCPFCLGYHLTFWLAALWIPLLPAWWLAAPVWLAARYVAWQLTPGEDDVREPEPDPAPDPAAAAEGGVREGL